MNTDDYEFSDNRYHAFVSVAAEILDGYIAALETLDDHTVNKTPLPGTVNTAFALVTHVHGMAHYRGWRVRRGRGHPP